MGYTGEQKRAYQRQWMQKRRQDWIDRQGGRCVTCGSEDNLEVDHIDPQTKLCHPAAIWSRTAEFREKELAKCQVLCEDCHMVKTIEQAITDHGTMGRYKRGCRCEDCKEVNRARVRRQRT